MSKELIATLDYIDGRSEVVEVDRGDLAAGKLGLWISHRDVVGITLTKKHGLVRLAKKLRGME